MRTLYKDFKYIYFEVYERRKGTISNGQILQNENILLIKPHTNSNGYWGNINITEQKGRSEPSYVRIEQHWIDFDKYKFGEKSYIYLDKWVNECLQKLKPHLREFKLKEIGI